MMNFKMIIDAYELAKEAHKNQKRKMTGEPYITHPLAVVEIVSKYTNNENIIIASFLHDVVEDTEITLEKIKEKFGDEVSFLVDSMTKLETPEKTFKKMEEYCKKNKACILIKLADRIHNTSCGFQDNFKSLTKTKEKYKIWNSKYSELGRKSGYDELSLELNNLTNQLK